MNKHKGWKQVQRIQAGMKGTGRYEGCEWTWRTLAGIKGAKT